ncbi:hypothetical protein EDB89DRAFT_2238561 [Lactarius sanguifluus]|nr:hypothetical protein EDB89DRAFT_2238561 [Lactarius sanguifluus]
MVAFTGPAAARVEECDADLPRATQSVKRSTNTRLQRQQHFYQYTRRVLQYPWRRAEYMRIDLVKSAQQEELKCKTSTAATAPYARGHPQHMQSSAIAFGTPRNDHRTRGDVPDTSGSAATRVKSVTRNSSSASVPTTAPASRAPSHLAQGFSNSHSICSSASKSRNHVHSKSDFASGEEHSLGGTPRAEARQHREAHRISHRTMKPWTAAFNLEEDHDSQQSGATPKTTEPHTANAHRHHLPYMQDQVAPRAATAIDTAPNSATARLASRTLKTPAIGTRTTSNNQKYTQDDLQWDREVCGATAVLKDLLEKWKQELCMEDHVRVGHVVRVIGHHVTPARDLPQTVRKSLDELAPRLRLECVLGFSIRAELESSPL